MKKQRNELLSGRGCKLVGGAQLNADDSVLQCANGNMMSLKLVPMHCLWSE